MQDQRLLLGRLLRTARSLRELTQEEVASVVGIGTSTLRAIEGGRADGPNFYSVLGIMSALGIEPEELRPLIESHVRDHQSQDWDR